MKTWWNINDDLIPYEDVNDIKMLKAIHYVISFKYKHSKYYTELFRFGSKIDLSYECFIFWKSKDTKSITTFNAALEYLNDQSKIVWIINNIVRPCISDMADKNKNKIRLISISNLSEQCNVENSLVTILTTEEQIMDKIEVAQLLMDSSAQEFFIAMYLMEVYRLKTDDSGRVLNFPGYPDGISRKQFQVKVLVFKETMRLKTGN